VRSVRYVRYVRYVTEPMAFASVRRCDARQDEYLGGMGAVVRGLAVVVAVSPLLVGSAGSARAEAPPSWRSDGTFDGMAVERRDVPGSSFDEIRVSTTSPLGLQALCDAIYPKRFDGKLEGRFKKRELLRETDTERWTYEQISVAVISDRDYVMHVKLEQPASTGRCEVGFETETRGTRPAAPGFVRIPLIRGHWSLAPAPGGKVSVRYEVYSDPGGGVPAFLARGGQRSAAVDFMKVILARANPPPKAPSP